MTSLWNSFTFFQHCTLLKSFYVLCWWSKAWRWVVEKLIASLTKLWREFTSASKMKSFQYNCSAVKGTFWIFTTWENARLLLTEFYVRIELLLSGVVFIYYNDVSFSSETTVNLIIETINWNSRLWSSKLKEKSLKLCRNQWASLVDQTKKVNHNTKPINSKLENSASTT